MKPSSVGPQPSDAPSPRSSAESSAATSTPQPSPDQQRKREELNLNDVVLTSKEACAFLKIGRTTLWGLVKRRAFRAFAAGDGPTSGHRFLKSDLMRWFLTREILPVDEL